MLLQVALDALALLAQIARRVGERDTVPRSVGVRGGRSAAPSSSSRSRADVVREIVELQPEVALGLGAEDFVELADLAGFRIDP